MKDIDEVEQWGRKYGIRVSDHTHTTAEAALVALRELIARREQAEYERGQASVQPYHFALEMTGKPAGRCYCDQDHFAILHKGWAQHPHIPGGGK